MRVFVSVRAYVCLCVINFLICSISSINNHNSTRCLVCAMRKWSLDAPKSISERSAILSKCGRRCFLGPGKTFPICARLGTGSKFRTRKCKIDRRGVQAAYIRAREWASITARKKSSIKAIRSHRRYTAIARKANSILSK